jgi:hypothetical protein
MTSFAQIKKIPYAIKKYGLPRFIYNAWSIAVSDVVIVSFQKCGKTWLRVMLSKILQNHYNIKDIRLDLQEMSIFTKAPNILISHAGSTKDNNTIDFTKVFKHKKVIFLVRDPRDIVVSLFHGSRTRDMVYSGGSISEFIRDPNCGFPKIMQFMDVWAKNLQQRDNYIIVRYEDMKKDSANELQRICNFVDIPAKTSLLQETAEYGDFKNMRKLEMSNKINDYRMKPGDKSDPNSFRTRKGKSGGYLEELSAEDIAYVDKLMQKTMPKFLGY